MCPACTREVRLRLPERAFKILAPISPSRFYPHHAGRTGFVQSHRGVHRDRRPINSHDRCGCRFFGCCRSAGPLSPYPSLAFVAPTVYGARTGLPSSAFLCSAKYRGQTAQCNSPLRGCYLNRLQARSGGSKPGPCRFDSDPRNHSLAWVAQWQSGRLLTEWLGVRLPLWALLSLR